MMKTVNKDKELIFKSEAINALWKALYSYQDKTDKQFRENENLDYDKWFIHRIFVQNMNDEDRKAILNLPSVNDKYDDGYNAGYSDGYDDGYKTGKDEVSSDKTGEWIWEAEDMYKCSSCGHRTRVDEIYTEPVYEFCPYCNARIVGYKKY